MKLISWMTPYSGSPHPAASPEASEAIAIASARRQGQALRVKLVAPPAYQLLTVSGDWKFSSVTPVPAGSAVTASDAPMRVLPGASYG
jgi:hypothetical protein